MSAFNGSGTFVVTGVGLPYVTATTISSTVANQLNTDLATGLSTAICKDGQTTPTANIPMGGFKLTGIGVATVSGDALSYGQAATLSTLTTTGAIVTTASMTVNSASGFTTAVGGNTFIYNAAGITSNAAISCIATSAGVILANNGNAWAAISDERQKTNLTSFGTPLDKVASLRAGTGRYLADPEDTSRAFLIAQDVQAVLPEAVDVGKDGMLLLRYTDLIPLLVAALAEVKARLETLEAS